MSRLYDTVEPSVIDDEMLTHAVHVQGPKDEAGRIAREEGIDFGDVKSLRLDFKSMITCVSFGLIFASVMMILTNALMQVSEFVCRRKSIS